MDTCAKEESLDRKSLQNFQPILGLLEIPKIKAKIKTRYYQSKKTYNQTSTLKDLRVRDDSETLEKAEPMSSVVNK